MDRYHRRPNEPTARTTETIFASGRDPAAPWNRTAPVPTLGRLAQQRSTKMTTDLPTILTEALEICESTRFPKQLDTFSVSKGELTLDSVYVLKREILANPDLVHVSITNMSIVAPLAPSSSASKIQCILVEALCQPKPHSSINSVDLSNCQLDDEIALQIASHILELPVSLRRLNLSGNKITDVGAAALAKTLAASGLQELDLSSNRFTKVGVLAFCEHIPSYRHLKVLRLEDNNQLLPVAVYQQFSASIEKNHVLQTLTLGSETMDGTLDASATSKVAAEKEMDALLRYFWEEPVYTAATNHIRYLLRLNCSGLGAFLQTNRPRSNEFRTILATVERERQVEACYRILQLKPDLLTIMLPSSD